MQPKRWAILFISVACLASAFVDGSGLSDTDPRAVETSRAKRWSSSASWSSTSWDWHHNSSSWNSSVCWKITNLNYISLNSTLGKFDSSTSVLAASKSKLENALYAYLSTLSGAELASFNRNECKRQTLVLQALQKLHEFETSLSTMHSDTLTTGTCTNPVLESFEKRFSEVDLLLGRLNDKVSAKNSHLVYTDSDSDATASSYSHSHGYGYDHKSLKNLKKLAKNKRKVRLFRDLENLCADPSNGIAVVTSKFKHLIDISNKNNLLNLCACNDGVHGADHNCPSQIHQHAGKST